MAKEKGGDLLGKIIWEVYPKTIYTKFYNELYRASTERILIQLASTHIAQAELQLQGLIAMTPDIRVYQQLA